MRLSRARVLLSVLLFLAVLGAAIADGWRSSDGRAALLVASRGPETAHRPDVDRRIGAGLGVGAIAVLVEGGRTVHLRGYGWADLAHRAPVDPTLSRFRIGSVTKVLTGVAVALLVERGQVDPSAPANAYLGEDGMRGRFGSRVRVADLLTHRAGLEDNDFLLAIPYGHARPRPIRTPSPAWAPGETLAYSNFGPAILGRLIEHVTGSSFKTFVTRDVLAPLHLDGAAWIGADPSRNNVTSYAVEPDGAAVPMPAFGKGAFLAPSGGLTLTGADAAKLIGALLDPDIAVPPGSALNRALRRVTIALAPPAFGLDAPRPGYLLWSETAADGSPLLTHGGVSARFESQLVLDPKRRRGAFVAVNSGSPSFSWRGLIEPRDRTAPGLLSAAKTARSLAAPPEPSPAAAPVWAKLAVPTPRAGVYVQARRAETTIERMLNDRQWAVSSHDGRVDVDGTPYRATGPRAFRSVSGDKRFWMTTASGDAIQSTQTSQWNWAPAFQQPRRLREILMWASLALLVVGLLSGPSNRPQQFGEWSAWIAGASGLVVVAWPYLALDLEGLSYTVQDSPRQYGWAVVGLISAIAGCSALVCGAAAAARGLRSAAPVAEWLTPGVAVPFAAILLTTLNAFHFIGWHVHVG